MVNNRPEGGHGDLSQLLEQSLCGSISCPSRLHRIFIAAAGRSNHAAAVLIMRHMSDWQSDWGVYYDEHHRMGIMGFILLLLLGIWYGRCFWLARFEKSGSKWLRQGRQKKHGSQLLQKSARKTNTNYNKYFFFFGGARQHNGKQKRHWKILLSEVPNRLSIWFMERTLKKASDPKADLEKWKPMKLNSQDRNATAHKERLAGNHTE